MNLNKPIIFSFMQVLCIIGFAQDSVFEVKTESPSRNLTQIDDVLAGCEDSVESSCLEDCVPGAEENSPISIPVQVKGILLVGCEDAVETGAVEPFNGMRCKDLVLPGREYTLFCSLKKFLDKDSLTKDDLLNIKREIILYYQDHCRPVIAVEIPKQDITDGVLQVIVTESCVGCFRVVCNEWFCDERILSYMTLCPGDVIDANILLNDVAWANRNPFRATDVVFTPGECEGTTDIELRTQDRLPIRPYVGGDNQGTRVIGNTRLFAGFQWGNFFGLDDIFSYQYTTTTHPKRLQAHSMQYYTPLPWKHEFIAFGGYAKVKTRIPGNMQLKGESLQASARYDIPYQPLYGPFSQDFIFGFDFKNTNNNLLFLGENIPPVVSGSLNLFQLVFAYNTFIMCERTEWAFVGEVFWSPGKWLPNQTNSDYEDLRPHARNKYVYGRTEGRVVYHDTRGLSYAAQIRGQASSETLLPSEQYGLGGADTVRGYDERAFIADNAVNANVEIRSNAIKVLCGKNKLADLNDELIFLVFLDYGLGNNWHRSNGDKKTDWLLGVGPGLRYAINPYISFRCDWGIKLHRIQNDRDWSKFHLGFQAGY